MAVYDVLVSDELLPDFTNDNPLMPAGFRVLGRAEGPAGPHQVRMRVEDSHAPEWTQGRLVTPTFESVYHLGRQETRNRIVGYHEESEPWQPGT